MPISLGWPSRPSWQYVSHATHLYGYDTPLFSGDQAVSATFASQQVYSEFYRTVSSLASAKAPVYLAFSPDEATYDQLYGVISKSAEHNLQEHLLADHRVSVVAHVGGSYLFRVT
jgi:hypothetical protein